MCVDKYSDSRRHLLSHGKYMSAFQNTNPYSNFQLYDLVAGDNLNVYAFNTF